MGYLNREISLQPNSVVDPGAALEEPPVGAEPLEKKSGLKQPQAEPSRLRSQISATQSKFARLQPSQPIESQKKLGLILRRGKKKTIFESDTSFGQIDPTQLTRRGPSPVARPGARGRKNPLETRVPGREDFRKKSPVKPSALEGSRRTETDPYGEIYDYSQIFKGSSAAQEYDYGPEEPGRERKSVPFKNFVETMAKRHSVQGNAQFPETGSKQNGRVTRNRPNQLEPAEADHEALGPGQADGLGVFPRRPVQKWEGEGE